MSLTVEPSNHFISRKYDVVQLLGERGAAVNVRGKSGSTAFDVANMISE